MAQLINITSEALQRAIRQLLPSQQGFGEDLQATNVITPIIDLTPTAEGADVPISMQQAVSFGNTAFNVFDTTTVIADSAGFYRVFGVSNLKTSTTGGVGNSFDVSDGLTSKKLWFHQQSTTTNADQDSLTYDYICYLRPGDTLSAISTNAFCTLSGSIRQVADNQGTLVPPLGFTPQ
jgi:hypothetical protein